MLEKVRGRIAAEKALGQRVSVTNTANFYFSSVKLNQST